MSHIKTRYDVKMYLGDLLAFRAYLVDEETYYFLEVPNFGIDTSYRHLFEQIIKGDFNIEYYAKEDLEKREATPTIHTRVVKGDDVIARIEDAKKMLKSLFGLEIKTEEAKLSSMIAFRYDGHDLNIDYGLNPKSAADVFSVSLDLIKVVASNNTNFGEVLQMKEKAGSTVIPFESERVDEGALEIIKRALRDINRKSIDSTFAHSDEPYAKLYKQFIRQLKNIRKIKDLKTFEIILDKAYKIEDLDYLKEIDAQLYTKEVTGVAKIHHIEKYLKSRQHIYSVAAIENGSVIKLHIDDNLPNSDHMRRIVQENDEKTVAYKGIRDSESVVVVSEINKYYE